MKTQLYRHGDILIKAENLPDACTEIFSGQSYTVATGEHTNHKHIINSDTDIKVHKDELGNRYLSVGGKMKFKDVMEIKDIDQRWVALKMLGADEMLRGAKAELLDSSKKNSLYLVKDIFPSHPLAYFLRYVCPSTGRIYISGIDPEIGKQKDADLAQAWKHNLTKSEYLDLEPLINES